MVALLRLVPVLFRFAPFILAGLLILALWIQTNRLDGSTEKIERLEAEISGMKSAALLTERLQKDNADISRKSDDMRREIDAAESSSQPLPPDILRILRGLHEGAGVGSAAPGS